LIDGEIRLMDFDGDGRYNAVTVDNFESFVMKYYDGASSTIFAKNSGDYIDLDSYEYVALKDESGKAIDAADIPADSVLNIMATRDGERIKVTVSGKSIEGQVEEINSSDGIYGGTEVKIGGKAYGISRQYEDELEKTVSVGSSIIAYINMFDRIIAAEVYNPDGYNAAYLMNAVIDSASFDKSLKLYMYKSDGKIETKSCAARITVDGIEYKSNSAAAAAFPQCVVSGDTVTLTPQIIKYRENADEFITEIDTYNQGNESTESSLARTVGQESEVMKFNARIGKKEVLSANTKVYHVPQDSDVMSATEKDFKILGTNSINSRYSFKLECYRLRGSNEYADIVVYRRSFDDTKENDWWNSSIFLVKENYEMSDADSESLRRITGLINGGEGYIDVYESELADTVKISPEDIKEGDLIRYRTNFNGRVHDIELLYDPSGYDFSNWKNYNEAVSLFDPTYDQYFQLSFGYVSESSVHNVGWGYKSGAQTDELVDLSSVPCMFFDRNERDGKRVYTERSASVRDYKSFGDKCDRIIVHLKNGNPAAAVIYR
ncbi:MAG: hypothetical protein Q4E94_03955, partial [Clostridia bacterium]|nr:hypothetical protein [Clostridia bacterium]